LAAKLFGNAAMRRTLLIAAGLLATAPAHAAGVSVAMDEVRTITFPKSVTTVYVGNPAIADINMIDSRHAFILGKGYGNTNMVALDQDGKQVSDTHISVLARRDAGLTLQRGASRVTYSCTAAHCEITPQPGDGKEAFDAANGQIAAHQATAKGAAGN
jgi:Flp pilus assembly secretin CpaC